MSRSGGYRAAQGIGAAGTALHADGADGRTQPAALRAALDPHRYDIVHAQDCISADAAGRCVRHTWAEAVQRQLAFYRSQREHCG